MKNVLDTLDFVDQNDNVIKLGDTVIATHGPHKNITFKFVFSIPQHRFGFINVKYLSYLINGGEKSKNIFSNPNFINTSKLDFYYTPRNVKTISIKEELEK